MATVTINDQYLEDIAAAIRNKSGTTDTYKPKEMADAIAAINSGEYVIKDELTEIPAYMFHWQNCISKITSEENVPLATIGDHAFNECDGLRTVDLSGCVNLKELGSQNESVRGVFASCSNLTSIVLPPNLESIGQYAFEYCSNLKSITFPNTLKVIGPRAFFMSGLEGTLTIPASVEQIRVSYSVSDDPDDDVGVGGAFQMCSGLTEVIFKGTPTRIDTTVFANCANITSIKVPWSEGEVAGAPWAAINATVEYNYR